MAATRKAPPTHPSVWIGLGLAAVGLLVAAFAYSGTQVYDIVYAFVAMFGALLAIVGILLAAWGRAVMSARASRAKRGFAPKPTTVAEPPPTVAEPASKGKLDLKQWIPKPRFRKTAAEAPASDATSASPVAAVVVEAPQAERLELECPNCATRFTADGRPPFVATCPSCGHAETVG